MRDLTATERSRMASVVDSAFDYMNVNTGITIYNKYIVNSKEAYQRTQVTDIEWQSRKGSNVIATGGNIAADAAKIVIPVVRGTNYLAPKAWQALVSKTGKWTLQIGDFIVKGLITDEIHDLIPEITGPPVIPAIPAFTITNLKAKYDDVLSISSVDLKDGGSQLLERWEVAAK